MSSTKLILITGASGYVGAHVVQQALEAGYSIRATARPNKVDALQAKFNGQIEVVPLADFINGDYTEALKGVEAVLHLAAPLPGTANKEEYIEGAVGGALNILRQAAALGIKRVVITSSFVTVVDTQTDVMKTDKVLTENDWNHGTREQVLKEDRGAMFDYSVAKTLAEHEIWKFADAHPETDITTLNPPYVFGPHVSGGTFPKGNIGSLSTAGTVFYKSVLPDDPSSVSWTTSNNFPSQVIDVRDLARAHILALDAPPATKVRRKRILLSGPTFSFFDAVKYLYETRPEIRSRLAQFEESGETAKVPTVDISKAKEVLGLEEFIDWKKTVDDTVDFLLDVEKAWAV